VGDQGGVPDVVRFVIASSQWRQRVPIVSPRRPAES
jgi:hypothetical protein